MTKTQTAANIIKNEAIALLAAKHGTTEFIIVNTLQQNASSKLAKQFKELVTAGVQQAIEMHKAGEICIA